MVLVGERAVAAELELARLGAVVGAVVHPDQAGRRQDLDGVVDVLEADARAVAVDRRSDELGGQELLEPPPAAEDERDGELDDVHGLGGRLAGPLRLRGVEVGLGERTLGKS